MGIYFIQKQVLLWAWPNTSFTMGMDLQMNMTVLQASIAENKVLAQIKKTKGEKRNMTNNYGV